MKTPIYYRFGLTLLVCLNLFSGGCASAQTRQTDAKAVGKDSGHAATKARIFYYNSVPRHARQEVTVVHVQAQYLAQALWAKGQRPDPQLRDAITLTISSSNHVHDVPIRLAEVSRIAATWRDGGWTELGAKTLEIKMKDGTIHSLTMVAASPDAHGPHLYRCTGPDGVLKTEVKGFFDMPLPNMSPVPAVAINPNTGARGIPTSVQWRFTGFTGLERNSQSGAEQPDKRHYISLRNLESMEFATEQGRWSEQP
jgi:hypothetical protein